MSCSSWKHGKSRVSLKHHGSALKYYLMLEGNDGVNKVLLYLKIRRCYTFLSSRTQTINCFYKGMTQISSMELVSVLLEADKDDEAISVLSPSSGSVSRIATG
ncbi:hypothetical protein L2E82_01634 [Cichorium intybus]|uniref:Uncharacterized protein n=1 Tax=Cichorium intybus TaxID=13427 RepID=A0ACB9H039_CICIN|nr:hypothetical protein L2E82_01634 [Cichorium intybus]